MENTYSFGIIGGMGPLATLELQTRILNYTKANNDQAHINYCVVNIPKAPDRSDALNNLEKTKVLQRYLSKAINDLHKVGCKYFAVPCNTVHHFIDKSMIPQNMTFIDMIKATKDYISKNHLGEHIIILGTDGNKAMRQYENIQGVQVHYPKDALQQSIVDIIYDVKKGILNEDVLSKFDKTLNDIKQDMFDNPIFISACTELSLFSNAMKTKYNLVDLMDVLVNKLIDISKL